MNYFSNNILIYIGKIDNYWLTQYVCSVEDAIKNSFGNFSYQITYESHERNPEDMLGFLRNGPAVSFLIFFNS